jgi:hypothetical protein
VSEQRACITVELDWSGWPHDEESWVTVDWREEYDAWPRAVDGFVAYPTERGVRPGGLHVGTDDWVRDDAQRDGSRP